MFLDLEEGVRDLFLDAQRWASDAVLETLYERAARARERTPEDKAKRAAYARKKRAGWAKRPYDSAKRKARHLASKVRKCASP